MGRGLLGLCLRDYAHYAPCEPCRPCCARARASASHPVTRPSGSRSTRSTASPHCTCAADCGDWIAFPKVQSLQKTRVSIFTGNQ